MTLKARISATKSIWSPKTQVEDSEEFEEDDEGFLKGDPLSALGALEASAVVVLRIRKDMLEAGIKKSYADSAACSLLDSICDNLNWS